MTAPAFHSMTTALAIVDRVIRAAGNRVDVSGLTPDELYFVAALPRSEDDRAFATSRISDADQARLADLFDRCSVLAVLPSAIGNRGEGVDVSPTPTNNRTRVLCRG